MKSFKSVHALPVYCSVDAECHLDKMYFSLLCLKGQVKSGEKAPEVLSKDSSRKREPLKEQPQESKRVCL